MITTENYEGWLMRYADGGLDADGRRAVEAFLAEHPDLREEMEGVAAVRMTPPVAAMPHKERLLRRTAAWAWGRAAAAVAVIVAALWLLMPTADPPATVAATVPTAEPVAEPPDELPIERPRAPVHHTRPQAVAAASMPTEEAPDAMAELAPTVEPQDTLPVIQEIVPLVIETDRLAVVAPTINITEGYIVDVQLTTTPMQTLVRGLLALKEE